MYSYFIYCDFSTVVTTVTILTIIVQRKCITSFSLTRECMQQRKGCRMAVSLGNA